MYVRACRCIMSATCERPVQCGWVLEGYCLTGSTLVPSTVRITHGTVLYNGTVRYGVHNICWA